MMRAGGITRPLGKVPVFSSPRQLSGPEHFPESNGARLRGNYVQQVDGKVVCKLCGEQVDIPEGETPKVSFHGVTGGPLIRVLHVRTAEVHRCVVAPPR